MATDETRQRLGEAVKRDRRRLFGTRDAARIAAKVNTATWVKVEEGEPVREGSLSKIEVALGWPEDLAFQILEGANVGPAMQADHAPDPVVDAIERSALSRAQQDHIIDAYRSMLDASRRSA